MNDSFVTNVNQVRTNLIKFAKGVMRVRILLYRRVVSAGGCAHLSRLIRPRWRQILNPLAMGSRGEERDSGLLCGPSRTAASSRWLLPAKAATTCPTTSSSQAGIRGGERSQLLSAGFVVALEQPVLLVFLNTIQVTRTPHVFFALLCAAMNS